MNKIYVGNLPYRITQEDLEEHFADCGAVVEVIIIKDRESGRSKGFGFVQFETADAAQKATELDGQDCAGRPLKVSIAKEKRA